MPEKSKDILVVVSLVILAFAAYAGTLTHDLVWDDVEIVKYIDSIVQDGGLSALVTSQFATHIEEGYVSGYYRPVVVVSLWFDSLLAGGLPFFYHLTNILLHILNTILVFVLLRQVGVRSASLIGAILFAVHTVHSESVSFVSGRTDLWAAFFILLAAIAWIRERSGLSAKPATDRLLGFTAFFMACLSKETAIMLPAVLLVWEAATPALRQEGPSRWWCRNRQWIMVWGAAISCVVVLRFLVFGLDLGFVQSRAGQAGVGESVFELTLIGQMLIGYLRLLVFPWPLRIYYGPAEIQVTVAAALGSALFLLMVLYVFYRCSKVSAVQGTVWVVLFLVPVLGVGARGGALLAERFLYLPSVGFCLLAGTVAASLAADRRVTGAAVGILAALMMLGTVTQNAVWKNEITLFSELVRTSPTAPGGHYNLGNAYSAEGLQPEAIQEYRKVVGIDPAHYRAYFNMGNSLTSLGRRKEAVDAYRNVLRIKPDLVPGYINLGVTLMEMGDFGGSASVYRQGIEYAPGDTRLHLGLALAYLKSGNLQAVHDHQRALEREDPAMARIIGGFLDQAEDGKGPAGSPVKP